LRKLLLMLCLSFALAPAHAAIESYEFESAQVEADYNKLIDELRCLVCQNQNLSGSDADLAKDLRRETYDMLSAGKSPDQVVEFMVARYGDFVLYRPQFQSNTYLLWLGPFLLLLVVLFFLVRRLRGVQAAPDVDAVNLERAQQILENKESNQ
jgi:cytochrome c-type biogenesis protein CcmH